MLQRPASSTIAAFFYSLAAVAFIGMWAIFLFTATPDAQTTGESVSSLGAFLFSEESKLRTWALAFAVLPIANISMAMLSIIGRKSRSRLQAAILVAGICLIPPTLVWWVTVAPASVAAAYYSYVAYRDTRQAGTLSR